MKILIAGDFYPKNALQSAFKNNKYQEYYKIIKSVNEIADFSIVNFEATLISEYSRPIRKCGPNLFVPDQAVDALKWMGFDMVTLANNHSLDFGSDGLIKTTEYLAEKGLSYVGVGQNIEKARQYRVHQICGKKLAVVNCCEEEFTIASDEEWGANPLRPADIFFQIQQARQEADHVIVITHSGHEHFQLPSLEMQKYFRLFVEAGADAIINHHQHCFSGMEIYKGKPIFYGLGNFLFNRDVIYDVPNQWHQGYMCMLTLDANRVDWEVIPYIQNFNGFNFSIIEQREEFEKTFQKLSSIIVNQEMLKQSLRKYYLSDAKKKSYISVMQAFYGRIYNFMVRHKLMPSMISDKKLTYAYNIINCESHRIPLLYAYKERINRKK